MDSDLHQHQQEASEPVQRPVKGLAHSPWGLFPECKDGSHGTVHQRTHHINRTKGNTPPFQLMQKRHWPKSTSWHNKNRQ